MLIEHDGLRPRVAGSAYVAPTAVLCGDVIVGEHARILFGAVLTAEGVFGISRDELTMTAVTGRYAELFGRHRGDRLLD